ncbi:MAG: radical SAM protein, partial [Candidatus Omnitrophota bacterium]
YMKELGIWVEVTTLVIPGLNDSEKELDEIASFISEVGREIPWHISRFHPDFEFQNREVTPHATLRMAKEIGKKNALKYVYIGNVQEENNTYCWNCNDIIMERAGFILLKDNMQYGKCPICGSKIEGVWK